MITPNEPAPASNSRKPGRPHALDDTKRREICALISAGCGIEGAAKYIGCAASTIRRHAARSPQFGEELRRAHLSAELAPLQLMRESARKYWRAAAWLLERTNPQRFAKQNVRFLKPEQINQFIEMMRDIVREEIPNKAVRLRVARRLGEIGKWAEREAEAQYDPIPKNLGRKRKNSQSPKS
jgi:hypothetical protein